MRETLELGPVPCEESCQQVGTATYDHTAARAECVRFRDLIVRTVGEPPEGASLRIKSNPHDFGTYLEVAISFDDEDEQACDYAYHCESHSPVRWNGEGAVKYSGWNSIIPDTVYQKVDRL